MRTTIQRVLSASVSIAGVVRSSISTGLLLLVGFEEADTEDDLRWLAAKVVHLRIFTDMDNLMNRSVKDIDGEILIVSQFTLYALTQKGNRPSFIRAARPQQAIHLYERFVVLVQNELGKPLATGEFGAAMAVALVNYGPITINIDTKNRA